MIAVFIRKGCDIPPATARLCLVVFKPGIEFNKERPKQLGNGLQTISYTYNERGWMTGSSSDKFGLQLGYNSGANAQWNGNIASMSYLTTMVNQPGTKNFSYSYDKLNRLTNAVSTGNQLDEAIGYDVMGNITSLSRNGTGGGSLAYTYSGNQLTTVTGFSPRSYQYDPNGNATSDGMGKSLNYNLLNLPQSVSQPNNPGSILATYTYDAGGNKLKNNGSDGSWDYLGGIVYHNNVIDFISTEEGRVKNNNGTWNYEYNLKDHLGNTRVSIDYHNSTARVIQEDEYYSFGLRKPTGGYDYSNNNRYLYNGKEVQTDLANQYDYGARFYDAVVGRWSVIDPLAEKDRRWSPYSYGHNNPIRNIDVDGLFVKPGDLFKSADAAAEDFGKYYNGKAILSGKESRSSIYSITKNGEKYYSYTESSKNEGANSEKVAIPDGATLEGDAHTHTNASQNTDNPIEDKFTGHDVTLATDKDNNPTQVPYYLAAPNGSLIKYDPKKNPKDATSVVSTNLPSDPKDRSRKNDISPITGVSDKKMLDEVAKRPVAKRDNIPDNRP